MNPSKKRTTVSKNECHSLFANRKTACRSENLAGSSLTFLVCAERFSHGGTFFFLSCTLQLVCLNKNSQMHYSYVVSYIGRLLSVFVCLLSHLNFQLCTYRIGPPVPTVSVLLIFMMLLKIYWIIFSSVYPGFRLIFLQHCFNSFLLFLQYLEIKKYLFLLIALHFIVWE